MSKSYSPITTASPYICLLQRKIRYAQEPDSPGLISHYLDLDCCRSKCLKQSKEHYEKQFRLLLDTVADELLPGYWRCICLDHINKPLMSLDRLSDSQDHQTYIRHLKYELNMTCNYVLHGLAC